MFITDPKTGDKSVSLTLVLISTVLLVGFGTAQALGKIQALGPFTEMFYSTLALYFGRRFNINGKTFSSDQAADVTSKLDKQ